MKSYKSILKISVLFLSVFSIASCEDKIQLKLDKKDSKITIDAFINNLRQDQQIRITTTDSYFSGKTPPAVIGAEVTVTDLTTNKKYLFADRNDGNYIYSLAPSDTMIVAGHSYQLNIRDLKTYNWSHLA
jgi:hypothetical protein